MSNPLGDFAATQTVTCRFTTEDASGAPITLAGTPTAQVRKGSGSGSVITAGVTLAVDVVTGQHVVDVNLPGSASYTAGSEYSIELSAGTVSGVSVVGKIVGTFSIGNRTLAAIAVQAIWDALTSALTTSGSIGKWILDKVDVVLSTRLATSGYTSPDNTGIGVASAAAASAATNAALLQARVPASPAAVSDIAALFTTAMAESYNADGSAPTPAQALFVIMQRLTEFAIVSTTLTAKKLDGTTTAFTLTFDDATAPTSSTRAT